MQTYFSDQETCHILVVLSEGERCPCLTSIPREVSNKGKKSDIGQKNQNEKNFDVTFCLKLSRQNRSPIYETMDSVFGLISEV